MSSPTLITPTTAAGSGAGAAAKALTPVRRRPTTIASASVSSTTTITSAAAATRRRDIILSVISTAAVTFLSPASPSFAGSDEEYVKETSEVINKVRSTITLDKNDPNVANAVAELRETSNSWVAKYRREKALLGRASFRDMYSALNAVSGHYISFGPTAPIPAKRKQRILEEMDTAEKNLSRGR